MFARFRQVASVMRPRALARSAQQIATLSAAIDSLTTTVASMHVRCSKSSGVPNN